MKFADSPAMAGHFHVDIWRGGKIIDSIDEKNLIVNNAKNQLALLVGGDGGSRHINRIAFGTGTAPASPNDTAITAAYIKSTSAHAYPVTGQVQFSWSLSASEANGMAITEFGLICADGSLFSRKVRAPIQKESDLSLTGTWTIIF